MVSPDPFSRIGKTVDGTSTSYLIDANTHYAQVFNETTGNNTIGYTYGNDLIAQSSTNGDYFYHYDALGSTRSLSDNTGSGSDGSRYTPYGELIEHTGSTNNAFLFTGEQFDPETENYYLRARYYSPGINRFTSVDPFDGEDFRPDTLPNYTYASNNPIINIDPSGKMYIAVNLKLVTENMAFRVTHISRTTETYLPYTSMAAKIALNSGHSVRALRALRITNKGIFKRLSDAEGANIQIHHVLERRLFENLPWLRARLGGGVHDMPGMAITASRHAEITTRWRNLFGYRTASNPNAYRNITWKQIQKAPEKIYYDEPLQKQALMRYLSRGI